jgi:hypothetical protein
MSKEKQLIEQYATYRGEPSEEDKNKFASYPNIQIKKHINPTGKNYIIVFEHIQILNNKNLNLCDKWKLGVNHKVSLNIPMPFPLNKQK